MQSPNQRSRANNPVHMRESTLALFRLKSQVDDKESLVSRLLKGQIVTIEDKDLLALYLFFRNVKGSKTEAIRDFVRHIAEQPSPMSDKALFDFVSLLIKKEMQDDISTALRGDHSLAKPFCRAEIMRYSPEANKVFAEIESLSFKAQQDNMRVQESSLTVEEKAIIKNKILKNLGEAAGGLLLDMLSDALKCHIKEQILPMLQQHFIDKTGDDLHFNSVNYVVFNFMLVYLYPESMEADKDPVWKRIYTCISEAGHYTPSDTLSEQAQKRLDSDIVYLDQIQKALEEEQRLNACVNETRQISEEHAKIILQKYAALKKIKNTFYSIVGKSSVKSDDSTQVLSVLANELATPTDRFNAVANYMNANDEKGNKLNKGKDLFGLIEKILGRDAFENKQSVVSAQPSGLVLH